MSANLYHLTLRLHIAELDKIPTSLKAGIDLGNSLHPRKKTGR